MGHKNVQSLDTLVYIEDIKRIRSYLCVWYKWVSGIMFKFTVYNYWRGANNYRQEKKHLFYKIIHFSMQFLAKVNRFIVKTLLNSTFTNDLKMK